MTLESALLSQLSEKRREIQVFEQIMDYGLDDICGIDDVDDELARYQAEYCELLDLLEEYRQRGAA
jgi:hypothetical protein